MSDPIAARRGDHHLCPVHTGDDIVAPCAPTILIGGQPAARLTDLVICIGGPLDIIQTGEPTVLLSGQQAARFSDGTNHGGLVDEGCPTVIIGKMTCPDKRMRLMERLRLIDAARKKAAEMPNGPQKDQLNNAADRLAQNNKAVEDARLSESVYQTEGAPEGWTRLQGDQLPPELRNATFHDDSSGFYSDLYRNDIDGSYRLVYRGTQAETWSQWNGNDWLWGNSQGAGHGSTQYNQAVDLARQVDGVYGGNLGMTGHSLGGGLASAGALATGNHANTFNAAGLHENSFDIYGLDPSNVNGQVDVYQTQGEILTELQENVPVSSGLMPDAVGTRHPLNAVDMTTGPDGSRIYTPRPDVPNAPELKKPDHWWQWATQPKQSWENLKNWGSGQIDQKKAWASEATTRHGIYTNGIEQQKDADIATIKAAGV